MACFIVTTVAAIGVGAAKYVVRHNEKKKDELVVKDQFINSKKLGILELELWGGAFLLAGEHAFHGEITYKFPFLTAVSEGAEATAEMLQEMGTIGVGMLAILVAAWFGGLFIVKYLKNRKKKEATQE